MYGVTKDQVKPISKHYHIPVFQPICNLKWVLCLLLLYGNSIINESIWESRFQYTDELNKMGAKITAQGKTAIFEGVDSLYGAPVYSTDLRAGAALIIAGICANGVTEVYNLEHIDRGYENIEEKFRSIGAKIERIEE